MIKRFIHGTVWLKLLAVGMVLAGMSEKSASLITGGLGLALCAKQVRDGIREQYWESPEDQAARHWEDLVWGHSQWVNPETPDEGIVRLTGPFRLPQAVPEDKHVAFTPAPPADREPPHFLSL